MQVTVNKMHNIAIFYLFPPRKHELLSLGMVDLFIQEYFKKTKLISSKGRIIKILKYPEHDYVLQSKSEKYKTGVVYS